MHDKLLWTNDAIQYIFHANITEYDMSAASLSVSERYHLLDQSLIDELKLMPKEVRTKKVGCLQRDNPEFSQKMIQGILDTRKEFIEKNGLSESNILTLHSDACFFVQNKKIHDTIGGVLFRHKNTWSSYIRYNGIEMFYADGAITYKNIPKELMKQHTLGLNRFLCDVFYKLDNYDPSVLTYIAKFQSNYLKDKLPEYYYIPFGRNGKVKMDNMKLLAYIAMIVVNEVKQW